jgi:DNA-binding transcriptional regulator YiaG
VTTEALYRYTGCGLGNVWLLNGYELRATPYGESVAIDNLAGLQRAIAQAIVDKPGPLAGEEIRFLRTELDLSQRCLGELLGRTAQSVALWEKRGTKSVPDAVGYLLRHIYRQHIDARSVYVEEVARQREADREQYAASYLFQETDAGWQQSDPQMAACA